MLPAKTREQQLLLQWGKRFTDLNTRCQNMMARLIKAAGPDHAEALTGTQLLVKSFKNYAAADAWHREIYVDLTVFWDAPDDTLAFVIAHELGHIALGHTDTATRAPDQSRQDEYDADDFGVDLAKRLGYTQARVFTFMHSKQGEYQRYNKLSSEPDSTHPNFDQRIDRAGQQGFQLSKGGLEQINTYLTHMA